MTSLNIFSYLAEKSAADAWRNFLEGSATHPPLPSDPTPWDRMTVELLAQAKARGGDLRFGSGVPFATEASLYWTARAHLDQGHALLRRHSH